MYTNKTSDNDYKKNQWMVKQKIVQNRKLLKHITMNIKWKYQVTKNIDYKAASKEKKLKLWKNFYSKM